MKKFFVLTQVAVLFCVAFSASVFADQSKCDADAVHCAYMSGLIMDSSDTNDGRYIKAEVQGLNMTAVQCLNNNGTFEIDPWEAKLLPPQSMIKFSICKDSAGSNCQPILNDSFTISKNSKGQYIANPKYRAVDLSQVTTQKQFPICNAAFSHRIRIH